MANTGLGSQLGLKKETTWGTAVTVDKFFRYESETFALERTYVDPVGLQAGITFAPQSLTKATTRTAGGGFELMMPYKLSGHLFDQMVPGTITPAQIASTTAYLSTFNVGSGGVPTKSATIQINKPATSSGDTAFTYPGSVLTSAEFSMATGGVLSGTWTWVSKDETTPATTPAGAALASATYASSDDVWSHVDTTLTYAGSPVAGVTGVTLTWEQPYADGRFFLDGSGTRAKPIPNGVATVTGTLTGEWYDSTFYSAFRSGAFAALVVTFAGPTAIAASNFPTIKFTLPAIQIRGSSPQVGGPDLLDLSIPFVAKYDGTNAPMKVEYTSTETTAW
jgi:hypothetical protein